MKREWGMVIDSKNGLVSAWNPEKEEWVKGPNSEDDQGEYWLCVKAAKHIRDYPDKFIEVMRESEKNQPDTR